MDDCKTLYEIECNVNADYEKLTLEEKIIVAREYNKYLKKYKHTGISRYWRAMVARAMIDNIKKGVK